MLYAATIAPAADQILVVSMGARVYEKIKHKMQNTIFFHNEGVVDEIMLH